VIEKSSEAVPVRIRVVISILRVMPISGT